MNTKPLSEWTKAELEEEIALYKELEIAVPEDLSNNEKRSAFIEEARKAHGIPHRVTAEDMAANKELGDGVMKEGDIVLLPEPTDAPEPPEDEPGTPPEDEPGTPPEDVPGTPPEAAPEPEDKPVPNVPATSLSYQGRPVVRVDNKIVNGRMYKEVHLPETTHLLTEEEYKQDVDPNHAG